MHSPMLSDFNLLKRILRYVKGTTSMGINIVKETDFMLCAYSDSDWGGCSTTKRYTGGYCTFLACEITWLCILLRELGVPLPDTPELYGDNLSSVHLTANPAYHKRSKHFELDYHFVRERVALKALVVNHIPAHQQIADIFTKSLATAPFQSIRFKLGVDVPPTLSLRGDISEQSSNRAQVQNRVETPAKARLTREEKGKAKVAEEDKPVESSDSTNSEDEFQSRIAQKNEDVNSDLSSPGTGTGTGNGGGNGDGKRKT
ncbi:Retrotransposon like protein [Raphanus sativus]|nr:Retrotransposon like protein [Raphanus sativus]